MNFSYYYVLFAISFMNISYGMNVEYSSSDTGDYNDYYDEKNSSKNIHSPQLNGSIIYNSQLSMQQKIYSHVAFYKRVAREHSNKRIKSKL